MSKEEKERKSVSKGVKASAIIITIIAILMMLLLALKQNGLIGKTQISAEKYAATTTDSTTGAEISDAKPIFSTFKPTDTAPTSTATVDSVTLTLQQKDQSLSGLNTSKTVYRKSENSDMSSASAWQSSNVFGSLSTAKTYYFQSQVTDNCGNTTTSQIKSQKTVAKSVTVYFHPNGGSGTDGQAQTFTYGVANQKFAAKNFSRTGYTQGKWAESSSGSGVYDITSGVSDSWIDGKYSNADHRVDLYATWTPNQYTITRQYRLQNADGSYAGYTIIDSKKYNYGTTIAAWSRSQDDTYNAASIAAYTVQAKDDTLSVDVTRRTATNYINARYQDINGNWGSYGNVWNGVLRVGQSQGWSRGQDTTYNAASGTVTGTASGATTNVDVSRRTYSIGYNLNGGSISGQPTWYYAYQHVGVPNPSRSGYNFTGWSGADMNTLANGGYAQNLYLTANWQSAGIAGKDYCPFCGSSNIKTTRGTGINRHHNDKTWEFYYCNNCGVDWEYSPDDGSWDRI